MKLWMDSPREHWPGWHSQKLTRWYYYLINKSIVSRNFYPPMRKLMTTKFVWIVVISTPRNSGQLLSTNTHTRVYSYYSRSTLIHCRTLLNLTYDNNLPRPLFLVHNIGLLYYIIFLFSNVPFFFIRKRGIFSVIEKAIGMIWCVPQLQFTTAFLVHTGQLHYACSQIFHSP